ncbi:unnamed protein product, partial [Urochloa humidicola]
KAAGDGAGELRAKVLQCASPLATYKRNHKRKRKVSGELLNVSDELSLARLFRKSHLIPPGAMASARKLGAGSRPYARSLVDSVQRGQ